MLREAKRRQQQSRDQRLTHDRLLRSVVLSPLGIDGLFDDRSMHHRSGFGIRSLGLFLRFSRLPQFLAYLVNVVLRLGIRRNALVLGHCAFTVAPGSAGVAAGGGGGAGEITFSGTTREATTEARTRRPL